jgi:hypothetical protein
MPVQLGGEVAVERDQSGCGRERCFQLWKPVGDTVRYPKGGGGQPFVDPHSSADPDAAVRKLVEIANSVEAVQDGRIFVECVNDPFLAAGSCGRAISAKGHFSRAQSDYFLCAGKTAQ